jgi:large subunit ribosomal protein L25
MQTLKVEVREQSGKGPARQLRARGKIPAVFYGPGLDTTKLSVSPKELLKALTTPHKKNVIISLDVGGEKHLAMVKDIAIHPVTRQPLHVDLYKVDENRPVEVRVPVKTSGRPVGVQKGGVLQVVFRDLPVRAAPNRIPSIIDIDVAHLDIGDVLTVAELPLDEGVTVKFKADRRVVLVTEPKRIVEETAEPGAEGAAPAAAAAPSAS